MSDTNATSVVNPRPVEHLYRLRSTPGDLLYVGITNNWPTRMKQHMADKPWWYEVVGVELVGVIGTRAQLEAIERAVIKAERPLYNVTHNAPLVARNLPLVAQQRAVPPSHYNFEAQGFRVGDDVSHPTFGDGIIIHINGEGDRAEAGIRFHDIGIKHLALAWAPLTKTSAF